MGSNKRGIYMTDGPAGYVPPEENVYIPANELLGPRELAILRGDSHQGVPTEYILEMSDVATGWSIAIGNSKRVDSELLETITAGLKESETKYPAAPMWDNLRGILAEALFDKNCLSGALDLLHGMYSRHAMARKTTNLAMGGEGQYLDLIFDGMIRRFQAEPDEARFVSSVQAMVDEIISAEPLGPVVDVFELMLRERNPGYDAVQGWADSQRKLKPHIDWEHTAAYVRDEEVWKSVPLRLRQHIIMRNQDMLAGLSEEPHTELVSIMIASAREAEEIFPDARAWDDFRMASATALLNVGYSAFALDFAKDTRSAECQRALVDAFIASDAEEEAFELASAITDPALMAEALLDAGWSDKKGTRRFTKIIQDEKYPAGRRLACMEVIRARLATSGNAPETVSLYDFMIRRLRQRIEQDAAISPERGES